MDTDGLDHNGRAQEALIYLLLTSLGEATSMSRPHSATLASLTRRGLLTRNEQGFHALTNGGLWWTSFFIGHAQPGIREAATRKQIIESAHVLALRVEMENGPVDATTGIRTVNGCPVIWERGKAVIIRHPQGFMLYIGNRIGTYKTLPGAVRRAEKELAR